MSMFSTITTAPAKQSVSETIPVLSGRLSTATLLEDRRAAILGLRSFAKQYPASVASGALRSLIGSLSRDGEDVDTVKVALETLLMLFSPDPDSPEASEEIALWVADEFTQRHENIALLLGFLGKERTDFYSRLYSLQLLSAILSARTERTEESIVNTSDGIPRLVAVLEDPREAVRDEAIGLLTDLTPTSNVIQNLVTLEKGFAPIFEIIANEGGLADGARVVEDCLILLANLLRLNPLNQTMFRDMGHVAGISLLLRDAYKGGEDGQEVARWVEVQRNRNVYAMLAVIRLLLVPGAAGTPLNQEAFVGDLVASGRTRARGGPVLGNTLQIAFSHVAELPIKSEALLACADMIRGNADVQARFAGFQVPSPLADPVANGQGPQTNGVPKVYIIDGLLDLVLAVNSLPAFDLRMAACTCLRAYFYKHAEIRMHFLDHAVRTHKAHADELTNALTILLQPNPEAATADPYRYWFAAVLMLHLLHDNPETKALAMSVTEGDEASGEEVVTSIQTMTAHLLSSVAKSEDPRISIGYLMLLLCWLFEDLEGVNDFLGEFTNLQGLIQAAIENPNGDAMVQGLSAMLAGVVYEFSTKDSPVPRTKVREMIMSRMGRDRYVDKLSRLRSHPLMRDHEVMSQKLELGPDQKLPDVYFDDTFVEFFKDNYSRVLRAIDRDPDSETSIITNGIQKGVSRKLVDALRAEAAEKSLALQEAHTQTASLAEQLAQEQTAHLQTKTLLSADLTRTNDLATTLRQQLSTKDTAIQSAEAATTALTRQLAHEQQEHQRSRAELARLKSANDALQRAHAQEIAALQTQLRTREEELQRQVDAAKKSGEQEAERARRRAEAEKADLRATISRLEVDVMKAGKARQAAEGRVGELEGLVKKGEERVAEVERGLRGKGEEVRMMEERAEVAEGTAEAAEGRVKVAEGRVKEVEGEVEVLRGKIGKVEKEAREAREKVKQKEEERVSAQGELDDMLEVFGDLEEKVTKYKERLKALGEEVSDGEDGDGDDDDDDEDEEEEEK
ncbi:p115 like vesicle tethering protein [Parachaetomium inaequale]|uniref:General vesicular transport factor p115 n=1 Tax=Parachaetomium inaequale TaxID=2588326 RepID=A0AAN6PK83_9PEZI|nr:p115 like vesicle tethering protein [Parachaetomium inaequale]